MNPANEAIIYRDALEQRAYAFGRLESTVRNALAQLEHGNAAACRDTLRRAIAAANGEG